MTKYPKSLGLRFTVDQYTWLKSQDHSAALLRSLVTDLMKADEVSNA